MEKEFQVGDLVLAISKINSDQFALHEVLAVTHEHFTIRPLAISISDRVCDYVFTVGKNDQNANYMLAFEERLINVKVNLAYDSIRAKGETIVATKHKCNCDKFQVIHYGCKCGGC